ncbi:MAG: peptidoglycan DD-metalloendopeptidase family protein [Nitrospirae bacterium]|nr:peptidoglycan DD-metalloendopeptidase family protein [Nitrospirota bacterium]
MARGGRLASGVAIVLVLVSVPPRAWAKELLADRIAQERRELTVLQEELDRIKKQRDRVSSRERSVADRLDETERALGITRRALRLAELNVAQKDQEIAEADQILEDLSEKANEARRKARRRLREIAKWQAAGYGRFVLAATPGDITRRYDAIRKVLERDRQLVVEAHAATERVTAQVQALERLKQELDSFRREEGEALNAVLAERETRGRLLRELRAERVSYTRSIEDLQEASRRLETLIDDLVRASRLPVVGRGFSQQKGRLIWPSLGEIVGEFGRHKHPRFDTYVDRKGIEIRVADGDMIRAVADGEIAYADRLKGFGMVVIIDHGEHYLSLYAHAASLRVRPGETVGTGQVIGTTRADGEDDRIYFELRHGEDPLDPVEWLLKRGGME